MTIRHPLRVTRHAAGQIRTAATWWKENRAGAPDAFREELERAFEFIALEPQLGARARNVRLAGVRRIYLARIRYDLYYRTMESPRRVDVLALWHSSRGPGPRL